MADPVTPAEPPKLVVDSQVADELFGLYLPAIKPGIVGFARGFKPNFEKALSAHEVGMIALTQFSEVIFKTALQRGFEMGMFVAEQRALAAKGS